MHNKRGNFYIILLSLFVLAILIGLFTLRPPATGLATKATKCFEGTAFGECSPVKPKYCDKGAFKPDCQRCGCIEGEFCQADGTCLRKCADGTLFGYCSENKPVLCFKGSLFDNCFECGCFSGQTCLQNSSCAGEIQLETAAEEKKEVVEEPKEEVKVVKPEIEVKEEVKVEEKLVIEVKKVGFLWNFFCKIFYFDEYDDCIADVIRNQNK